MKNYYRIMMGAGSKYIQECLAGNYIGIHYEIHQDLTPDLTEDWKAFNRKFIPVFLSILPDKSRVAAGLAMGAVHTVCKGLQEGDLVLSPDGADHYHVAEVTGPYYYESGSPLPHQRLVRWFARIARADMSEDLQNSLRAGGTVVNLNGHADQIEQLIVGKTPGLIPGSTPEIQDPYEFVMERHLEDFLVSNWERTLVGKNFKIYEDEGVKIGEQYQTDTGPIDILAISNDKKTLLVVELKKGRANDVVVGQILRYMGFVREELAEPDQQVKGLIIGSSDDLRLKRALAIVPEITFMRYLVNFTLERV